MKYILLIVAIFNSTVSYGSGNDLSNVDIGSPAMNSGVGFESSSPAFRHVSNSGDLQYSVEIPIFSGIGGRAPVPMSLQYTGSGEGVVGSNWAISGLPRIWSRGPSNSPPTGDPAKDELYISYPGGSGRLISQYNGASGDFYTTEFESFTKAIRIDDTYWRVWDRSGTEYQFKTPWTAAVPKPQEVGETVWLMTHFEDRHGNGVDYTWSCGQDYPVSGDHERFFYIDQIESEPYVWQFRYKTKALQMEVWSNGYREKQEKLLEFIDISIKTLWPNGVQPTNEFFNHTRIELSYDKYFHNNIEFLGDVKFVESDVYYSQAEGERRWEFEYNGVYSVNEDVIDDTAGLGWEFASAQPYAFATWLTTNFQKGGYLETWCEDGDGFQVWFSGSLGNPAHLTDFQDNGIELMDANSDGLPDWVRTGYRFDDILLNRTSSVDEIIGPVSGNGTPSVAGGIVWNNSYINDTVGNTTKTLHTVNSWPYFTQLGYDYQFSPITIPTVTNYMAIRRSLSHTESYVGFEGSYIHSEEPDGAQGSMDKASLQALTAYMTTLDQDDDLLDRKSVV